MVDRGSDTAADRPHDQPSCAPAGRRRYAAGIGRTATIGRPLGVCLVALAGLLAACGGNDNPTVNAGQASPSSSTPATTTPAAATTVPGHSYAAELTTADGRYKVTVALGSRSATGGQDCPGTAAAGRTFLPVTLIVANTATDKAAPFPPLRIEMTSGAAGAKPAQVLVRDPSGTCTYTPRVASIAAGSSVVFNGTTPAIDSTAAPGAGGQIQVSVSENAFSLVAPVP